MRRNFDLSTKITEMKKEFLKEKGAWKVTFSLPRKAVNGGNSVVLVGDFNDWDTKGIALEAINHETFETCLGTHGVSMCAGVCKHSVFTLRCNRYAYQGDSQL